MSPRWSLLRDLVTPLNSAGCEHLATVTQNLRRWMEEHEYVSIRQMRGSMSHQHVAEPAAFERANYLKVLRSYALRTRPGVG